MVRTQATVGAYTMLLGEGNHALADGSRSEGVSIPSRGRSTKSLRLGRRKHIGREDFLEHGAHAQLLGRHHLHQVQ